ncbi:MAG: stage III sporulation protein AC [Anaerovoracaceae bacterium]
MNFDINIIFKIAAIGICVALLNQILIKAGKEEQAMMTTLAGVIIVLVIIVKMLSEFFETIKAFMQF